MCWDGQVFLTLCVCGTVAGVAAVVMTAGGSFEGWNIHADWCGIAWPPLAVAGSPSTLLSAWENQSLALWACWSWCVARNYLLCGMWSVCSCRQTPALLCLTFLKLHVAGCATSCSRLRVAGSCACYSVLVVLAPSGIASVASSTAGQRLQQSPPVPCSRECLR